MRRLAASLWAAVVLAPLYFGWVVVTRHVTRDVTRHVPPEQRHASLPVTPDDGRLKILHFYASSGLIIRGEQLLICYGVRNASAVAIDPAADQIKPAMNRCLAVTPEQNTTYRLVARSGSEEASASFSVVVQPPPPRFTLLASSREIERGDYWAFCYGVEHASTVTVEPLGWQMPAGSKICKQFRPSQAMDLRVIATGEAGQRAVERLSIRLKQKAAHR